MIRLINVSKQYADKKLFEKVNLEVFNGEKVGVVGNNGSGKSTLLRIIAGEERPDDGSVQIDESVGYLKQITEYSFNDFLDISENIVFIRNFLKITRELNISENIEFTKKRLSLLSGGEKTKLMLANVMCKSPKILILDEPTNHLDSDGIEWLIDVLNNYDGVVVVVSHDRYFLNKIVSRVVEIENCKVKEFYGNYDKYAREKEESVRLLKVKYENQIAEERKINRQIAELNEWSQRAEAKGKRDVSQGSDSRVKGRKTFAQMKAVKLARQAKAKKTKLEQAKRDFIEKPYEEGEVYYRLEPNTFSGKVLVRAESVSKTFDENLILKNVNFEIEAGEKVALAGENGSGKSTLIKMILGKETFNGNIWVSPSVKVAYLTQDVFDLDENMTVMEKASEGGHEYKTLFLSNLRNMNMSRQVFDRKIKTLSLGERMRIKMCEIALSDYNFLILDEPTNHLDLNNKIFIEKMLKNYNGALLLVSHDKVLTERVATKTLEIKDKTIKTKI